MTNMNLNIREIAEALLDASPEEVVSMKDAILALPNGEAIHKAVSDELKDLIISNLIGQVAVALTEEDIEDHVEEENELADMIAEQLAAKTLAESIRNQVNAEPKVDLSALIKEQVEAKSLADVIGEQLNAVVGSPLADLIADQLEETSVAEAIMEEIIEEIVTARDEENKEMSLHPDNISLYSIVFETLFRDLAPEFDAEDVQYKDEYTKEIMLGIVSGLVEEGAELTFKQDRGEVFPVLVME